MENQAKEEYGDIESEDFPDEFQCCVCLDIMYKPVVLACGHISCFWCIFKAMDSFDESHCPVCRNPYNHFPSICRLLHSLLLKLYPAAYKRREKQVAEEEKIYGSESPQFDVFSADSHSNEELSVQDTSPRSSAATISNMQRGESSLNQDSSENKDNMTMVPTTSRQETITNETCKQVLLTDLQCALCNQLLCRPVVLNCGHVYCAACISNQDNKVCRCPVCQSAHPNGFPNVCLILEHFLEEHFPKEYSARRASLPDRQRANPSGSTSRKQELAEECSSPRDAYLSWLSGHGPKVHPGVGCDWCGICHHGGLAISSQIIYSLCKLKALLPDLVQDDMIWAILQVGKQRYVIHNSMQMCPITGERYKCRDCVEKIGFDLCEGCYKSSSKLPGRFNQQHTPDHLFILVQPPVFQGFFLSLEAAEEHDPDVSDGVGVISLNALSNDASMDFSLDDGDSAASPNHIDDPSEGPECHHPGA